MPFRILRLPTNIPTIDEERFPDPHNSIVSEHLTHVLARSEVLPAITVLVQPDLVVVTRGHKYLVSARELERSDIRAVVDPSSESASVEALRQVPGVIELDWDEQAHDMGNEESPLWHVLFFGGPIEEAHRRALERAVRHVGSHATHPDSTVQVEMDRSLRMLAFRLRTPGCDRDWQLALLRVLVAFHQEHVPIVSYQGRIWQFGTEDGCCGSA
jgi:hypothetical protein